MQQIDLSTSFHPKAYLHLALMVIASLLLLPVRGAVVPHLSANESTIIDWVLGGALAIMVLSIIVTIRKSWLTFRLGQNTIFIMHRILGTRQIPLQDVHAIRLIEIQGSKGYKYQSIELQLQSGKSTILDGLYNRGMPEFCEALASRLS